MNKKKYLLKSTSKVNRDCVILIRLQQLVAVLPCSKKVLDTNPILRSFWEEFTCLHVSKLSLGMTFFNKTSITDYNKHSVHLSW